MNESTKQTLINASALEEFGTTHPGRMDGNNNTLKTEKKKTNEQKKNTWRRRQLERHNVAEYQ